MEGADALWWIVLLSRKKQYHGLSPMTGNILFCDREVILFTSYYYNEEWDLHIN